jgi:hypothetical protein
MVAHFGNGEPLAAVHKIMKVAGLNFDPADGLTPMTGDYAQLVTNALAWVGKR